MYSKKEHKRAQAIIKRAQKIRKQEERESNNMNFKTLLLLTFAIALPAIALNKYASKAYPQPQTASIASQECDLRCKADVNYKY